MGESESSTPESVQYDPYGTSLPVLRLGEPLLVLSFLFGDTLFLTTLKWKFLFGEGVLLRPFLIGEGDLVLPFRIGDLDLPRPFRVGEGVRVLGFIRTGEGDLEWVGVESGSTIPVTWCRFVAFVRRWVRTQSKQSFWLHSIHLTSASPVSQEWQILT